MHATAEFMIILRVSTFRFVEVDVESAKLSTHASLTQETQLTKASDSALMLTMCALQILVLLLLLLLLLLLFSKGSVEINVEVCNRLNSTRRSGNVNLFHSHS